MTKLLRVFLILIAALTAIIGVKVGIQEIRAYQALKAEHLVVLQFLGESLGTRTDERGQQTPITRADVLNAVVLATLKNAEASK